MAEASTEEIVQPIRRFGAFLTVKFSSLFSSVTFNNLSSRSIGAIAGFAIAVVFTWRLLRSPRGPQRRVQKRQASSASSSSAVAPTNAASTASSVCNASEDLRAQNVVDEFFHSVKPTLGQILMQRLSDGRKVTCCLLGVVLEETDPEELQKKATVRSSVLEVLTEITKFCDLYLMEIVLDDESEKKVLLALEYAGVFTYGCLVKDKVLFCSTENGRSSFVRQLEPDWHIDTNSEIISPLARFIKYQLHVSPTRTERTAPNVFSSPSLELFFGSSTAFFPIQSCMNHSCQLNARAFKREEDRDGQATILACKPIRKGEEIAISYIDEDLPFEERQAALADYDMQVFKMPGRVLRGCPLKKTLVCRGSPTTP